MKLIEVRGAEPTCPVCGHHNAMLASSQLQTVVGEMVYRCRDCGHVQIWDGGAPSEVDPVHPDVLKCPKCHHPRAVHSRRSGRCLWGNTHATGCRCRI
jgi:DNA-directed RNA polymerase subunit M/transcription elongation factor TFIIS